MKLSSTCPLCGKKKLRRSIENYTTERKGHRIVVPKLEIYRCGACGEALLSDESMQIIEKQAARRSRHAA